MFDSPFFKNMPSGVKLTFLIMGAFFTIVFLSWVFETLLEILGGIGTAILIVLGIVLFSV